MSKHSVSDVINIAREKEITYEKVKHLSEEEVYRMIFPDKFAVENLYEQPDYEYVHQELKRVGVTLKLLWQDTQDYEALGEHYTTAIMPAGVRKPKHKPSGEGIVGKIAMAIIAKLRNEVFYSFRDLKAAVSKKLYEFNHDDFQKSEGSLHGCMGAV